VLFEEHERQRALAVVAGSALAAFPLGPLLGGWLLSHFWWGSVFLINVPVIVLAIGAVAALMPESRSAARPRLDWLGVLLSTAGLVALTYGVIEAGEKGWSDMVASACMAGGAVLLVGFVAWERRVGRTGTPLVDLGLFKLPGFSWGAILSTLLQFSLIGLIFAVPQYLRAVLGTDAMGAGLRLLPLIGGMIVGLALGDRISGMAGPRIAVTLGFATAGAGLIVSAFTNLSDGTGFVETWLAIVGFGTGMALPPAMNAAIGRLTGERSGVGSAVITAIRQVGGVLGVAVLGSLLNSAYRDRLDLTGLPAQAAGAVRDNVASGLVVAQQLDSAGLVTMVRAAFVHGMDLLLATSGGIAVVAAVLALVFLPGRDRTLPAAADGSATVDGPEATEGQPRPADPGVRTGQS
jgi:predicted MFS family arabinose efflux permease